jgi:hypothetical protein
MVGLTKNAERYAEFVERAVVNPDGEKPVIVERWDRHVALLFLRGTLGRPVQTMESIDIIT